MDSIRSGGAGANGRGMSILSGRDSCGDQDPVGGARGAYLLAFGVAEAGQRLARVVHGGHQEAGVCGPGHQFLWGPGLVAGSAGQGPLRVGVGEPPGPQGQVTGFGGVR